MLIILLFKTYNILLGASLTSYINGTSNYINTYNITTSSNHRELAITSSSSGSDHRRLAQLANGDFEADSPGSINYFIHINLTHSSS